MQTYRRTARFVGVFYIAATIAGMVALSLESSIIDNSDYLVDASAEGSQLILGALFELIMAVSVTGIAVSIYPVLRQLNGSLAIGYVAARLVEAVIFIIGVISLLALISLSTDFVDAGSPDGSYYQTLGDLLLEVRDSGGHIVLDVAVFPLGALMFYGLLYQAKLVPRWLSGWGIAGALLYLLAGFGVMFDVLEPLSTAQIALNVPLALQEMALALWLIFVGFSVSEVRSKAMTQGN